MAPAFSFDDVVKDFPHGLLRRRALRAVDHVSLAVEAGDVFALLGPNRAGKTTLVKMLLSLCEPTSGRVTRLGKPIHDRETLARVGYVHENQAFPRYMTATTLLEHYAAFSGVASEEAARRVPGLLERVGLKDRASEPIARFSKGMIQRLGIAQALVNEPDLLVLDEPSEGLDLEGRNRVHELVREFRARGKTVLLITHLLADVESLCNRVAVIVGGEVAFNGLFDELVTDQKSGVRRPLEIVLKELYVPTLS